METHLQGKATPDLLTKVKVTWAKVKVTQTVRPDYEQISRKCLNFDFFHKFWQGQGQIRSRSLKGQGHTEVKVT